MKTYSFVRENVGKILQQSNNSTGLSKYFLFFVQLYFLNLDRQFSRFNQYIYFLFAPTLIYRDIYPCTSIIQWKIVYIMFGQFIIIVCLCYHIIAYYCMPVYERFNANEERTIEFTISILFDLMLPGALIVILCKMIS
jgi:sterol O-acyltransferase